MNQDTGPKPPPRFFEEDCCVKNCDRAASYGLTMVIEGLRVELYACEPHFDILAGAA